eukprot:3429716-Heterocapsa_arctica.AAC.1
MACAEFTARILRLCRQMGVWAVVGNPASSRLWNHPSLATEMRDYHEVRFPMCSFGARYLNVQD